MLYLSRFRFPNAETEHSFRMSVKRTCYNTMYPFFVLSKREFETVEFEPITIFYGGNGSGKSTALNVIAEKLRLGRDSLYNRSDFFQDYVELCDCDVDRPYSPDSRIITSDDVFDFMLNIRSVNEGIDEKRSELFDEYLDAKYSQFRVRSLDDYERLKTVTSARRLTQSKFVKKNLAENIREQSNGESAFMYFTDKIRDGGLYLLDEPENSLSPDRQIELLKYLEDSARFFDCQFVIATHSPFILSLKHAKVYDLDGELAAVKRWTELKNVRLYYDFFKEHAKEFDE